VSIIWIYNLSISTMSCPSLSAMSWKGILTKFLSLLGLHLSLCEIFWRICCKFLYYSLMSKSTLHFFCADLTWNLSYTTSVLRAPAWEHWESCDSEFFDTLVIIRLKIPFGELFSKIIILRFSVFLFSKKILKFENEVKVRFPPNGMPQITRKDEAFVKSWNLINYC